jgi:hypothetical protein
MTKDEFYGAKAVVLTEWWFDECLFPELTWARIRVFSDGTADACWDEGGKLYGFESVEYAGHFLAEDEYRRFLSLDAEDEEEHGIRLDELSPPDWQDDPQAVFQYLGVY